jgi:ABC-type nitrate/sulfonate/bicarbonate transport system substrate-binding protein
MRRKLAAFVVVLALVCTVAPVEPQMRKIRVLYTSLSPTLGGLWVAKELRLFEKHGLDVELIRRSPIQALLAGEGEIAIVNARNVVEVGVQGGNAVIIANIERAPPFQVWAVPQVQSFKDLQGKTVGVVGENTIPSLALKRAGVQIRPLKNQEQILEEISQKQVMAGVLTFPQNIEAQKRGLRELIDLSEFARNYPTLSISTRTSVIEGQRRVLIDFLKAYSEGVVQFVSNRESGTTVISKYTKIDDREVLNAAYNQAIRYIDKVPRVNLQAVETAMTLVPRSAAMRPEQFVDRTLVQELEAPPSPSPLPSPLPAPPSAPSAPRPSPSPLPSPLPAPPSAPSAPRPSPSPLPSPLPAPPPPAPSKPGQGPEKTLAPNASWNTWIERDGQEVSFLEPNHRFEAVLDLSRYGYRPRLSALVDASVQKRIQEALTRGAPTLSLTVRPILIEGALTRTTGSKSEDILVVRLEQLGTPNDQQVAREAAVLANLARKDISVVAAASKLGAGSQKFPFASTSETGCGRIVFSIWDEVGQRPLDYIVHTVSVRRKDSPAPPCEENATVQGGFTSMSGILSATSAPQIDAALHVMEFDAGNEPKTVAMFLDAAKYRAARADKTLVDRGLYSWTLRTPLQKYLGEKGELLKLITSARDTGNYGEAAEGLKQRLFPPPLPSGGKPSDEKDASAALDALTAMARRTKNPPVILVRARTAQNVPVFVPLAVLAARNANLLATPPVVIHPLPRERYGTSTTCINRWSLGVPSRLDGAAGVLNIPTYTRMTKYETMKKLEGYLNPPPKEAERAAAYASSKNARGEGLIILGHQQGGNIWFTTGAGAGELNPEEYNRLFPPGSLAVLGACSAANPKDDNQHVLKLLNHLGIDVIVASPFPIEVSYAVELVRGIIESANEAYVSKRTPTILELFQLATDRAATRLGRAAKLQEKSLEFVIIGDHNIRLCAD